MPREPAEGNGERLEDEEEEGEVPPAGDNSSSGEANEAAAAMALGTGREVGVAGDGAGT